MSTLAAFDAVVSLIAAEWTRDEPIVYENDPAPPRDANGNDLLTPWVLCEIVGISDRQMSMGSAGKAANYWQARGELYFHIHAPVGAGPRPALVIADALAEMFRARFGETDNVTWLDMSIGAGQIGEDNGKWWSITVTVEWQTC